MGLQGGLPEGGGVHTTLKTGMVCAHSDEVQELSFAPWSEKG